MARRIYKEIWTEEKAALVSFCGENGYTLEFRNPDAPVYQLAKIDGPGFTLIAYPHTVKGTGNQHIRIRQQGSTDTNAAYKAIEQLDKLAGLNCTFKPKHQSSHYR
jgi:hypothetical protein